MWDFYHALEPLPLISRHVEIFHLFIFGLPLKSWLRRVASRCLRGVAICCLRGVPPTHIGEGIAMEMDYFLYLSFVANFLVLPGMKERALA